jgi:hypothetical protein
MARASPLTAHPHNNPSRTGNQAPDDGMPVKNHPAQAVTEDEHYGGTCRGDDADQQRREDRGAGAGRGTSGFPERSSHSCTEVPASALPMAGAVTVVRVPECSVPLGSGHLARAAGTREVATGPGWDSTAAAGRRRAAAARWDWQMCPAKHAAATATARKAATRQIMTAASIRSTGRRWKGDGTCSGIALRYTRH